MEFVNEYKTHSYFYISTDVMGKLFFIMTMLILSIIGCSKARDLVSHSTAPVNTSAIEFSFQGSLKHYDNIAAARVKQTSGPVYSFVATKDPQADNYFNIILFTDSLRPGKYVINETGNSISLKEGELIANNCVRGPVTVTITSNNGGVVNGSFEGYIYSHLTNQNEKITGGKLQNVKLIYY